MHSLSTWGVGAAAPKAIRLAEAEHERRVSAHVGALSVLWLDVPDEPSPRSTRAFLERNAITLLSNNFAPLDSPSEHWLGRHSPREVIWRSGLWNLKHVNERLDPDFFDVFEESVCAMAPEASSQARMAARDGFS